MFIVPPVCGDSDTIVVMVVKAVWFIGDVCVCVCVCVFVVCVCCCMFMHMQFKVHCIWPRARGCGLWWISALPAR